MDNPDNAHIMDSTQYDNDGTKKGADEPIEIASGEIDSAQLFDGDNDCIEISTSPSLDITSAITMEVLIKAIEYPPNNTPIIAYDWYAPFALIIASGIVTFGITADTGTLYYYNFNTPLGIDEWGHLLATWDGINIRLFRNGVSNGSYTWTHGAVYTRLFPFNIGGSLSQAIYLHGFIDESRLYNEYKSAEWILADYNSGADTLVTYAAEETFTAWHHLRIRGDIAAWKFDATLDTVEHHFRGNIS